MKIEFRIKEIIDYNGNSEFIIQYIRKDYFFQQWQDFEEFTQPIQITSLEVAEGLIKKIKTEMGLLDEKVIKYHYPDKLKSVWDIY